MKYDDVSWHCGGNFPEDLPDEAGATHIGMFLAWAIMNGLEGDLHKEDSQEAIEAVRQRRMTGAKFLLQECDWKLTHHSLNEEGNQFCLEYYGNDDGYGQYLVDYEIALAKNEPSLYHIEDSWPTFDKLYEHIQSRYEAWKSKNG